MRRLWLILLACFAIAANIASAAGQNFNFSLTGTLALTPSAAPSPAPQNAACSTKHNFDLGMVGATSLTQMTIVNLDSAILCTNAAWTTGPIAESGPTIRLTNLHYHAAGTPQGTADITASGVSTPSIVGGLDTGTVTPNTDYCLWLVANDTAWGVVWSATCSTHGPQGGIQSTYPYYAYLGWNRSNASGTAFYWALQKIGTWSFFVGGTLPGVVTAPCGAVGAWCNLTPYPLFVSPNAGEIQFTISNAGGTGYVAIAPTPTWGGTPGCFIQNGSANDNIYLGCPIMITSGGHFGYAITSPSAGIYIAAFNDPR
jgi:hypothetical protein